MAEETPLARVPGLPEDVVRKLKGRWITSADQLVALGASVTERFDGHSRRRPLLARRCVTIAGELLVSPEPNRHRQGVSGLARWRP